MKFSDEAGRAFELTVRKPDDDNGDACHEWIGPTPKGRPTFVFKGKSVAAAKHAYQLVHGPIGRYETVYHRCGNPLCCNVAHLERNTPESRLRRVIVDAANGCWEIAPNYRDDEGYGRIWVNGRKVRAHRLAYELWCGEIPQGKVICHECHNPACVNPAHLRADTQAANMRDRDRAGRLVVRRGEDHHNARLTQNHVEIIKMLYVNGDKSVTELAEMHEVSLTTIYDILAHRTWWKKQAA